MEESNGANRTALAAGVVGLVAVLIAVAALLDLGPFADDELSVAGFLAQGDEICTDAHDEFLELQSGTPRTAEDAEELTQALIDIAEEERDALESLDGPASLDEPVAAYLDERGRGIELLRDGLEAARDDDPEAYEETQSQLARGQVKREKVAKDIGFNECSQPLVEADELERQAEPPAPSDPSAPPTVNNPPTGS